MADTRLALDDGSLVDLLDRLLDTGVALEGSVLITLAQVDLIRLDLRLLLASVQTLVTDGLLDGPAPRQHRQHGLRDPDGRPSRPAVYRADRSVPSPDQGGSQTVQRQRPGPAACIVEQHRPDQLAAAVGAMPAGAEKADPAAGVAGLVLAVVDIVRQLLERQAVRRMDAGTLTAEQVERLGRALIALERQVRELSDLLGTRRSDTTTHSRDDHGRGGHIPPNQSGRSITAARRAKGANS